MRILLGTTALMLALAACNTTDPDQGGFFGGLGGLASGSYERDTQARRQGLAAEQARNQQLRDQAAANQSERQRVAYERSNLQRPAQRRRGTEAQRPASRQSARRARGAGAQHASGGQ